MDKKELKKYLKDHPIPQISVATFADVQTSILLQDELMLSIEKITQDAMPGKRMRELNEDAEWVAQLSTPEELVKCMRSAHHFGTLTALAKKVLEQQEETIPLILKRFMTSFQDSFLENASKILSYADKKYAEELLSRYKDIRSPYAQALACFVFGFQGMVETIPLQLKEVEHLQRVAPNNGYHYLPVQALNYLIEELP